VQEKTLLEAVLLPVFYSGKKQWIEAVQDCTLQYIQSDIGFAFGDQASIDLNKSTVSWGAY